MAQQILNVSTPNSGLGDALRDASIKSNDNFTELYEGKVDKVVGKDLSDNNLTDELVTKINDLEAQAQVNVQSDWNENDILADAFIKNKPTQLLASLGYFDYADLATQTTPITVSPDTPTLLTNDTLGDGTDISQPPYAVNRVYEGSTANEFDFSQLSIGDTVDIRFHIKVTTSANNQLYHIDLKAGIGSASEFENRIFSSYVKNAGVDEQTFVSTFYIGSNDIKDYPAQVFITSAQSCTVKVVGWFVRVFRKSVNIVGILVEEDAPSDGLTYGRKDAEWVEVSGGGTVPDATTTVKGIAQIATSIEGTVGTNNTKIVTPLVLKAVTDALTVDFDDKLDDKVDLNTPITGATKTKITYDSKGLVTSGADATTADIADSTNKRYVTDAQLTVIGNTSGNNTGDQDLSGFLKKVFSNTVATSAVTGTLSETIIYSVPVIPGGTFNTSDFLGITLSFAKTGGTSVNFRIRASNTNDILTAPVIATLTNISQRIVMNRKNLHFRADNTLNGYPNTTSAFTDDNFGLNLALTSTALNPANNIFIFITIQLTNTTESVTMTSIKITK